MQNTHFKRLIALFLCVALIAAMAIGCGDEENNAEQTMLTDCSVTVQTEGGVKLANVGVTIYTSADKSELVDFVRTDENGVAKMNVAVPAGSCVFLTEVPDAEGYVIHDYYTIDGKDKNLIITLTVKLKNEMTSIKLGDVMFDFSVTDQNGTEHTLSKLLESKKAVVINLWYTTCGPCKMEFPFLQQAYNEYKDNIALLAITPMDSADAIAAFATENGLTIPMAACDPKWNDWMVANAYGYPTTIVVDRFGTVAFIHSGSIDNSKTFKNVFAYFTADDYKHTTISGIEQFVSTESENTLGTATNPYEYTGNSGFTVEAEPGQTVYYSVYGADGLNLSADGKSLKVAYNNNEYYPADGKISFNIYAATATLAFTNTGSEKASYKVTFSSPAGSESNPLTMKDGSITAKAEEGNSRGVYYQYKAADEGTFTLECKNTVNYTVSIRNTAGKEIARLSKDKKKVSLDVSKGEKLQIVVTAAPADGEYPAVEAKLAASFKKYTAPTGTTTTSEPLNTNGKLSNENDPIVYGGADALAFSAEVKAGEMVLYNLFKISGTTLRIVDATAYVVYNGKTYTPDKTGVVYVTLTSPSPSTPIVVQIGNGGKSNKTFAVKCTYPEGSKDNPYDAVAGTIKTNIAAGNDQGVYYQCTAEKTGKMTISLKNVTSGVNCDIRVDVIKPDSSVKQELLSQTEDGKTLTVNIEQGNEIVINIVALPDEDYKYPAATVETVVSFS